MDCRNLNDASLVTRSYLRAVMSLTGIDHFVCENTLTGYDSGIMRESRGSNPGMLSFPGISLPISPSSYSFLPSSPTLPSGQSSLAPQPSPNRWAMFGTALRHAVRLNWAWRTSCTHTCPPLSVHALHTFPPSSLLKEPLVPLFPRERFRFCGPQCKSSPRRVCRPGWH